MQRFQHRFTLPLILTFLVLALAGILVGFFNYQRQTTLPSNSDNSVIGVQLNQEMANIDLHQLQANNVSFVYLQATQGRSYFDDKYLTYREQLLGTKLAYGTIVRVSDESSASQQFAFLRKKVGRQTGSLPVLLQPAVTERRKRYLSTFEALAQQLEAAGKRVIVELNYRRYHRYFRGGTSFMATGAREPNQIRCSFWRYTNEGHVKNVNGLERNVVMYSYNGTVQQYKQKYGQLTQ